MWLEAEFQGSWHLYKTPPSHASSSFFSASLSLFFLSTLSIPLSLCLSLSFCVFVSRFLCSGLFFSAGLRVSSLGSGGGNHARRAGGGRAARLFGAPGTRLGKRVAFLAAPGPARPPQIRLRFSSLPSRPWQERNGLSVGRGAARTGKGAVEGATAGGVSKQESVCVCAWF